MIEKLTELAQYVSTNLAAADSSNIGPYIGAGLCMLGAMGCGIGEGIAASKACEAVGRNPEAENKIRTMMVIGCAISETSGIYGLIIALLLLFVHN
ncbi:MAG: ATP synthase F0 subunit C [Mycoplasmataceae bacterium]|jgi:F-type H+-transporting ATPase subunit c|nr:ATP synthase F0 subunit C [Mycoplasmataceae bacterium]